MRTIIIIIGGFLLFALCFVIVRLLKSIDASVLATSVKIFVPIWLGVAGINMWLGVARAGYLLIEELPIFLLIFSLPVVVALFISWKFS